MRPFTTVTVCAHLQIAAETITTLHRDRERLVGINERMDDIQGDLQIANKLITRFVKRLYTDKIIMCFVCLIVLAIAGACRAVPCADVVAAVAADVCALLFRLWGQASSRTRSSTLTKTRLTSPTQPFPQTLKITILDLCFFFCFVV